MNIQVFVKPLRNVNHFISERNLIFMHLKCARVPGILFFFHTVRLGYFHTAYLEPNQGGKANGNAPKNIARGSPIH